MTKVERAAIWGTGLFLVTAIAAVVAPEPPFEVPAFAVALLLFLLGIGAFVLAYTSAVQRSRDDIIGVTDLFFLAGDVAPPAVKRNLLGALAAQVLIALATAIARPYSSLAAGTLVPVYGIGLTGLWAARHGTFPPRRVEKKGKGKRQ